MAWLPVVVTAAPAEEPVSLEQARAQCHVDGADFDSQLQIYIGAARRQVENETGTKLVSQTVLLRASSFTDLSHLPIAPIASVANIKYLDAEGAEQTLATDVYEAVLVGLEPAIRLKPGQSWPPVRGASDAVRVTAQAGYGDAADIPEDLRLAMLLLISDWNDNRGDTHVGDSVNAMPNGVPSLLVNHRRYG